MKKQIVICCPSYKNLTKQDLKEINDLLLFKKRYKKYLTEQNKNSIINT